MTTGLFARVGLMLAIGAASVFAVDGPVERELIGDNHFHCGFTLWKTEPGKHIAYGQLPGITTNTAPVWGLSQWNSRFPLAAADGIRTLGGMVTWSNAAKSVTVAMPESQRADICMAVNMGAEYAPQSRKAGEPWVHLLLEQEWKDPAPLAGMATAKFHIEARLLRARRLPMENYSAGVHAAQFQVYFTVQNRKTGSPGYGDLLWFLVPIYDDRDRFPKAFMEQDFGGTAKFIFTPDGKTFSNSSAHDGGWVVIDKELLPLMREALTTAWARGFLKESKEFKDYYISGVYMGWELPGSFEVEMQVRNLSLKAVQKPRT
jgi:hypothetical protein